jgi:lysophospholipase L1-like esterase
VLTAVSTGGAAAAVVVVLTHWNGGFFFLTEGMKRNDPGGVGADERSTVQTSAASHVDGVVDSYTTGGTAATRNPVSLSTTTLHDRPIRIFCLGDSLTSGFTPTHDRYPYAGFLLASLDERTSSGGGGGGRTPNTTSSFHVDDAGYPGWTTHELLDLVCRDEDCPHHAGSGRQRSSRRPVLPDRPRDGNVRERLLPRPGKTPPDDDEEEPSRYDIFIYLAGTNDLGRHDRDESEIVTSILEMHSWAHHVAGIPITMAIAIPPSAYQTGTPAAADKATRINAQLRRRIETTGGDASHRSVFVPFPFPFDDDEHVKQLWSRDGLHCSEAGYRRLGEYLAEVIATQFLS